MQTELSKIVQNSEESQVSLYERSVSIKKGLRKFCIGLKLLSPLPPLIARFYAYGCKYVQFL